MVRLVQGLCKVCVSILLGAGISSSIFLGQYKFYAVKIPTLTDVAGFPIIIDGHYANNDNTRYFVGGTLLNRPGLAMIGNIVVGGFGGHCDNFNYTGMLVSVSKTTATVTNIQAMVAAPGEAEHTLRFLYVVR